MNREEWEASIAWVGVLAGCVIKKDGKYLLVQEKQAKAYGKWNLPAGHVDKGESIEDAALREVLEESGFEVKLLRKIDIFHEDISKSVKHIFAAEIVGGELHIQEDEILDVKWLAFDEVKSLNDSGQLRAPFVWESIGILESQDKN